MKVVLSQDEVAQAISMYMDTVYETTITKVLFNKDENGKLEAICQ